MGKIKLSLIIVVVIIIIIGELVVRRKYFSSQSTDNTTQRIENLISKNLLKNGDLIFQTSLSSQSKAIQMATNSKYSHCGLIYKEANNYYVFEAIQPVKRTPLAKWIARGKEGHFVIKRLKNADTVLTPKVIERMRSVCNGFTGKDYDIYFEWSDDKIYCSELIWKVYQRATGIEIGNLQKLREFDLSNESVKTIMHRRYGTNIPLEEKVISPARMFNSNLLTTIKED